MRIYIIKIPIITADKIINLEWEVSTDNGATWTSTGAKAVGIDGKDGADGKDGINGVDGQDGKGISAVAVTNGELVLTFSDNSSINLGSIKGADGKDGTNGVDGKDGANGSDGKDGIGIANVTISPEGALTVELTSGTVLNLGNIKGENGIGITKSEISADGELILTYTDGKTENLGAVVGRDGTDGKDGINGQNGVGIKSVTLSADGELIVLMTDNSVTNLGNIKGEKGDTGAQGEKGDKGDPGRDGVDGKDGADGKDGRGIAKTELVNGELVITYTDGTFDNLGAVGSDVNDSISMLKFTLLDDDTWGVSIKDDYRQSTEKIVIPSSYHGKTVTKILREGFVSCTTLKEVYIPNTVTTIDFKAFLGCRQLITINIPASVINIESNAFLENDSLTTVYFEVVSGWNRFGQNGVRSVVSESILSDPQKAATELRKTYEPLWTYVYKRNS